MGRYIGDKSEKLCSCTDTCSRWGQAEDGSYGYYCPYLPQCFGGPEPYCKAERGGKWKPTIIPVKK